MKIPLYRHQKKAVRFLDLIDGVGCLFMEMGTGKTRTALAFLFKRRVKRILVVCPPSAIDVWAEEVELLKLPYEFIALGEGSLVARAGRLRRRSSKRPVIVAVNYDAYWREPLRTVILRRFKPDAVVLDEAHRIKNRQPKQSQFAHLLSIYVPIRLALTGTPISEGIQNAFSIFKFVDDSLFGNRWADFALRYLKMGGYMGRQIKGYRNVRRAKRLIASRSFFQTKAEALDLPPELDVPVFLTLSPRTRRAYDEMKNDALAVVSGVDEDGRDTEGTAVAKITLTSVLRLQQLAAGFVRTEDAGIITIGAEKFNWTMDKIADVMDADQSIVIFCRFTRDITRLQEACERRWPRLVSIYSGKVKQRLRDQAKRDFQARKTRIMIAQIKTGSESISLTAASTDVYYTVGHSLIDFLQARNRLPRAGQKSKVTHYYLIANDTVDESVYMALDRKQAVSKLVTRLGGAKAILGGRRKDMKRLRAIAVSDALGIFKGDS